MAVSPFLHPGVESQAAHLAVLHLRRDHLLPVVLRTSSQEHTGYAEGAVENTRFGSYPHSTLIQKPWGTQIIASKVDTGSRGRPAGRKRQLDESEDNAVPNKKLKIDESSENVLSDNNNQSTSAKLAVKAASGFCHIIPPTPETWTSGLPHRTQVVYTPDYSYILQKLRVRPGEVVIEAGAGSGSFTHAAARAVFNRYRAEDVGRKRRRQGRVWSYEYHEPRATQLQAELRSHGLEDVVTVTNRDVCGNGFLIEELAGAPAATRVFLDLPAPWDALPHLTRKGHAGQPSPLSPHDTIHICCFLPCIEQVTKLVTALRSHAWVEIEMFAIAHRRLDVRRERVGLDLEGLRGVNATARTIAESLARLRDIEARGREFRDEDVEKGGNRKPQDKTRESKQERLARIAREEKEERKVFKDGRLVVRTEPEIKTHTSYLVFAVLPLGDPYVDEGLIISDKSH